ncbi:MAG: V-type ATP synthase subunit K [Fervidicoccus sp.]|nr:MAG: V-type ATP synthase subunit K [Fervidicoccus sp.]
MKVFKLIFFGIAALLAFTFLVSVASAQTSAADASIASYKALGAGLAVGLAGIGGGYAVAVAGSAGLSALTEKSELFSNVLLIVALGEGIAIYGLIVAILIIIMI